MSKTQWVAAVGGLFTGYYTLEKECLSLGFEKIVILITGYIVSLFVAGFNTVPQSGQPFRAAQLLLLSRYVGSKPRSKINFLIEPTYPAACGGVVDFGIGLVKVIIK